MVKYMVRYINKKGQELDIEIQDQSNLKGEDLKNYIGSMISTQTGYMKAAKPIKYMYKKISR